jgi:hypothetical protein
MRNGRQLYITYAAIPKAERKCEGAGHGGLGLAHSSKQSVLTDKRHHPHTAPISASSVVVLRAHGWYWLRLHEARIRKQHIELAFLRG